MSQQERSFSEHSGGGRDRHVESARKLGMSSPTPCGEEDADLWFAESPDMLALAKGLCQLCAVRAVCLAGAIARAEPWGVWGGEIFDHGRIVAAKRGRGRPPKRLATRPEPNEASARDGLTTSRVA